MAATFLDIAITPDVMDVQHEMGSDSLWQTPRSRRQCRPLRRQRSGDDRHPRQLFIWRRCRRAAGPTFSIAAARRGFCICWMTPPPAMADFGGNRQYITTGNLRGSDRACLFLMDYPRRAGAENLRHRRGPRRQRTTRSCWRRWRRPTIAPALNVCFFFICRRLTGTARSTLRRATARSRWRSTARTCSNVFMTSEQENQRLQQQLARRGE